MEINWLKNLARLYLPIYQYESDKMKIAYVGYSSIKKKYFVRLLLDGNKNPTFLGRRWFWQIPDLIKSYNLDMVISEISPIIRKYFHKWNGYVVPEWIRMKINIDRPISEICKTGVSDFSDVMRRIRKYNMTYEIQTERESFDYFNRKFYLPYISKRHGEEAWIEDLDLVWKSDPPPLLLAIKEDGVMVGAVLIKKSEDSLQLLRLGLLDGNDEYRHHGVIGALYYFGVLEGQKMGCKYLDVGGTRPFLTDGLTKFKIGLGAEFGTYLSPTAVNLWLGVNENSSPAAEFIKINPIMHINKDFKLVRSGT
jgi:hypothetical protein